MSVVDEITSLVNERQLICLTMYDFSKEFDPVMLQILKS